MRVTRPHIEVDEAGRATAAQAVGAVISDLTRRGWDIFIPMARTRSAALVALLPSDPTTTNRMILDCRSAIIDEHPDGDDVLYCYPRAAVTTHVAMVDNRDGAVWYAAQGKDGGAREEPHRNP